MFKFFSLFILLFLLCSCGFKPMLASQSNDNQASLSIKIGKVEAKNVNKVERLLEEALHIDDESSLKLYRLNIEVETKTDSEAIRKDGVTSRYRLKAELKYSLQEIATGNIINIGSMYRYGSYNVADSDFMNYMSDRYTSDNLLRDLFIDLRNRLNLVLINKTNQSENTNKRN